MRARSALEARAWSTARLKGEGQCLPQATCVPFASLSSASAGRAEPVVLIIGPQFTGGCPVENAFFRRWIAHVLRSCVGRKSLVRAGRFLVRAGRFDDANDFHVNGEQVFLRAIVSRALDLRHTAVVIDVGANQGIVACFAAELVGRAGRVYAIEPCRATFEMLTRNIAQRGTHVTPIHAACSDRLGEGLLNVISDGGGTNSLVPSCCQAARREPVSLVTLDAFAEKQAIDQIDFVKIDTEGHDFSVLRGSRGLLNARRIAALQFEYNWRWIGQRSFLKDVFEFVRDLDYQLGKVTCRGIEFYDHWRPDLETFVEGNYALVRKDVSAGIPTIPAWYS